MANYQRLHYIDWIRVLAFLTLILFHCAVPFVEHYHWEINDKNTSPWITRIIWWLHQWRLPLLFFIAGVGVSFSLRKRSIGQFMSERFIRLFIPLVFAMFFITPMQVYFEWLQEDKINISYWEFWPSVFDFIPYPEGSLTWSHMWFVAYLFVFTILLLPIFSMAKIKWFSRFTPFLNTIFKFSTIHFMLAIPFVAYIFKLFVAWPEQGSLIDDWFVFAMSITFYVFGFLLSGLSQFWESCRKNRRLFLYVSVLLAIFLFFKYYWNWQQNKPDKQDLNLYIYAVANGFHIWCIILAVVGYTMRYLNYPSRLLSYLTTAVYPYYILHQLIIVATGYFVTQWNIPIVFKIIALLMSCAAGVGLLYHFIIRKTIFTRILFGVKWNYKWKKQD